MVSTSCFGTTNVARPPPLKLNRKNAEMAEWSNAHDSKSCYGQLYGGSNPSLCAKKITRHLGDFFYLWRLTFIAPGYKINTSYEVIFMKRYELHPIFKRYWICNDHYDGELEYVGDALGRDCMVAGFLPEHIDFARLYTGDGTRNVDWFGWNAEVLAPISGTVKRINVNPVTNTPGTQNPSPASFIIIEGDDGVCIMLGHVQNIKVSEGDKVREGQTVAAVGNNGYARSPHIHIGAWKDNKPLAIGFDPKKTAKVFKEVGEIFWIFGISEEEYNQKYKK